MFSISWDKIDKFYLVLALILIAMTAILIISFRGVFSLFLNSYEFDSGSLPAAVRVDREKLNEAYNFVFNKNIVNTE